MRQKTWNWLLIFSSIVAYLALMFISIPETYENFGPKVALLSAISFIWSPYSWLYLLAPVIFSVVFMIKKKENKFTKRGSLFFLLAQIVGFVSLVIFSLENIGLNESALGLYFAFFIMAIDIIGVVYASRGLQAENEPLPQ